MLPGLGFNEILILGVLALVVIGPKDLPLMLRKVGRWTAKLRGMAQEFRTGFDELARQAELDELKREVEALRRTTNLNSLANEITKPLPTLEDYAGVKKPAASEVGARLPLDGGGVAEGDGGGAHADAKDEAARGQTGSEAGPPLSHAARDSSPPPAASQPALVDSRIASDPGAGEREAQPVARSVP